MNGEVPLALGTNFDTNLSLVNFAISMKYCVRRGNVSKMDRI